MCVDTVWFLVTVFRCASFTAFSCNRKLLRNVPITQKRSARMRPDACGICLLKQTASGAQSVTSPQKIEGFREFEADLSALFSPVNSKTVIEM